MGSENVVGSIANQLVTQLHGGPSRDEGWLESEYSEDEPEERNDV